jgi:hypothetical protein
MFIFLIMYILIVIKLYIFANFDELITTSYLMSYILPHLLFHIHALLYSTNLP